MKTSVFCWVCLFRTQNACKGEQEKKTSLHLHGLGFWWARAVTMLGKTIYFEIVSQQEVSFVALVKFSTHWGPFFFFSFEIRQSGTYPSLIAGGGRVKRNQFTEKCKLSVKNVNTVSIFVIFWKFPWKQCSVSIRLLFSQNMTTCPSGEREQNLFVENKITEITALSRTCYSHLPLTFSKYLLKGKRWGILVVKGASSPLQWSLCTSKWSWVEINDQEQNRTGRWG